MKTFLEFLCNFLIGIIMWPFVAIMFILIIALWPIIWAFDKWDGQI